MNSEKIRIDFVIFRWEFFPIHDNDCLVFLDHTVGEMLTVRRIHRRSRSRLGNYGTGVRIKGRGWLFSK